MTTISTTVSNAFRAAFESHPARHTDPALALASARETAAEAIPAGVTGSFDDESLTFSADSAAALIPWRTLTVRHVAMGYVMQGEERISALREYRDRDSMLLGTFDRTGGAWETDEPHTWGPEFSDDVDWTGLDGGTTYRVIVGERGNEQGTVIDQYPFAPLSREILSESEAREVLADQMRAYGGDGWGRIEYSADGENWERLAE